MSDQSLPASANAFFEEPTNGERGSVMFSALRVALLVGLTFGLSSFVPVFSGVKSTFLMKNVLGLTASQLALLNLFLAIPAYLRAFMGAFSDFFPIFGSHRRSYYLIAAFGLIAGYFCLSLFQHYTLVLVACCVVIMAAGGTMIAVMTDAVMVSIGNQTGTVGRLQAIQQGTVFVVGLATTIGLPFLQQHSLTGYIAQHWSYQHCFLGSAVAALLYIPLSLLIQEKRIDVADGATAAEIKHERHNALVIERTRVLLALKQAARSPHLWAITFFVFYLIITPGGGTAQFYFFTGPLHFKPANIGDLGFPGNLGSLAGIVVFAIFSKYLPARWFVALAFLGDCVSYPLAMCIHDYNSAWIISLFGGAVGIIYALSLYTLAARACPPGIEGTAYGLVMSAIAIGGTMGDVIGSQIFDFFGPHTHHSITYGWWALNWIGLGLTILAALFIPFLPTWARSNEPLRGRKPEPDPA